VLPSVCVCVVFACASVVGDEMRSGMCEGVYELVCDENTREPKPSGGVDSGSSGVSTMLPCGRERLRTSAFGFEEEKDGTAPPMLERP